MAVVERKPVPIYESVCTECKSKIAYKASEVGFGGYITCPVCGSSMWANTTHAVRYELTDEGVLSDGD